MKKVHQLLLSLLLHSLLHIFSSTTQAKSVIEPCNSNDSCTALLSYRLPYASKLSEIAFRFQVNLVDILATNNINPSNLPLSNYQIFPAKSLLKVPVTCPCTDGIRRSLSTVYTVRAADTVDSISESYGGLVSAEQIRIENSVNETNPLTSGQRLEVPLPCTCFNNSDDGVTAVYMSYVVVRGENLGHIAAEYGTTVSDLEAVNGIGLQGRIRRGDVVAVPLPACSSANLDWHNESIIVPNGSYVLTANNCIKCSCEPLDLSMQCSPSGIADSCSHLQCKGSNLFIGQSYEQHTAFGCNVTTCVYRGHSDTKIFSSLLNYSHIQCSGNKSHATVSPFSSPPSKNGITIPFFPLPPSPSPSPSSTPFSASDRPTMIVPSDTARKHSKSSSRDRKLLSRASTRVGLLLLELAFSFIL